MKRLELATSGWEPVMNYLAAVKIGAVALVGVCFFNGIIGVFGLSTAIISLVVFILLALWAFARVNPSPAENNDDRR